MFHLHKSIVTLQQGISSVSVFYFKLKDLWDEYESVMPPPCCECPKSKDFPTHFQYQRLLHFLLGLNDGYSHARSQILMKSTTPIVNQAFAMILHDESQKLVVGANCGLTETVEPGVFFSARNTVQRPTRNLHIECDFCYICVHTRDSCRKLMKCDYCHMSGHLREKCYKLIGYPLDFKSKKKNPIVSGNLAYAGNNFPHDEGNFVFTGPMSHAHIGGNYVGHSTCVGSHLAHTGNSTVCSSGSNFYAPTSGHNFTNVPMIAPQQQSHIREMLYHFSPVDTGATHQMVDNHQLLVDNVELSCWRTSPLGDLRVIGREKGGLYILTGLKNNRATGQRNIRDTGQRPLVAFTSTFDSALSFLRKISAFQNKCISTLDHCEVFPMTRKIRLPFPHCTTTTNVPFELIHMDVWGPHKVITFNGMNYFLTLVDDYSRSTWIFLLRLKSDVIVVLKSFIPMITNQFERTIKVFRSDNATEFFNTQCVELFRSHDIIHQSSCPYTPQQNGYHHLPWKCVSI
ncbi:hypothetical protein RDI58_026823 [Solanum bulbocastanum]|uniref:Integrase catalytic domain-containing protein n=1 Tax=Solanum bulbocastanum TaxID=147425 RepID=A0AAN8SX34_SOLBU